MTQAAAPHVLLITTDHWPAALLGSAGHPVIHTPTLDQLARNGTRFTNAYSECPICIPARRTLMTGCPPRDHGDRTFQVTLRMPEQPTLAQCFRDAGYQAFAVGKLHVYPQRDRIGFDDVLLAEEGRPHWGVTDDYEVFLGQRGFAGRQFEHGMSNNEYLTRTWHLPEDCHVTNWATREMARMIRRRDPNRPGFWYLSYAHPHPPLVPPATYWDMYSGREPDWPSPAVWSDDPAGLPYRLQVQHDGWHCRGQMEIRRALQAFYALCTHIDHQLRVVLGTLREEGILDNTIVVFTSDHGDMLGRHGLWAKRLFYEYAANVPMILMGTKGDRRVQPGTVDDRLVGWQDVMPTLLGLAGLPVPESVAGRSMATDSPREFLYGECLEDAMASRMIRQGQYKLIYYPAGHQLQLFDVQSDPEELVDLAGDPQLQSVREQLTQRLLGELYGSDLDWIRDGELVGLDQPAHQPQPNRELSIQRGLHWPPPPVQDPPNGAGGLK